MDSDEKKPGDNNEFEKELSEIREWQDNQFNPGHYIGTGRIPRPLSNLSKVPAALIVIGVLWAIPWLLTLFLSGKPLKSLSGTIIPLALSFAFIYGGFARIRSNKPRKHK